MPEVFWTRQASTFNEIDINKEPPSREFLEKHIDADRFLDFVSTRSPVFKERPLPKSKKEAIDADDGEPEPDPPADHDQGVEGHLRLRQGRNTARL